MQPTVLFLGGVFPKEHEKEIIVNSRGVIQNAANALQWNLIEGFDANLEKPVQILNALYVGSFPLRYKKIFIPGYKFSHIKGAEDFNIPFCNLIGLKYFSRGHNIKHFLKKWIRQNDNSPQKIIIAYALTSNFLDALTYAKKMDSNIKTCVIVPDLPQYMNTDKNVTLLYKIAKKIDERHIKACLSKIDFYVLLTEQMNEYIKADKYVVMEGISTEFSCESLSEKREQDQSEKRIVYTGTLNERYGVKNLVDAFELIPDSNLKLILCGNGDSESYIKQAQDRDKRIVYKGNMSRTEVLKIQHDATILVNPRQNTEDFTKYSFPSKIMEYMSSGTPIVLYKLDGIPKEYDDYLTYVSGDSVEDLAKTIIESLGEPLQVRIQRGKNAKEFVTKNKNKKSQALKILNMIINE